MISLGTMFSVARRSALPSLPLLSTPAAGVRFVSIMSSLSNNPGAYRKKKRLGRGPSSGKGKTSGRGMNGQKQKEKVARWHEGGQTPMHKTLPKFGFTVYQKKEYVKLNLDRVQSWIEQGRLDPSKPITMKHLLDSRACRGIKDGVKLLANGKENFKYPINITVNAASREAVKAVRALGGTVTSRYYNQLTLRALLHPEFFKRLPLPADPVDKASLEYYRKYEVGGYLARRPAPKPTAESTEPATAESA